MYLAVAGGEVCDFPLVQCCDGVRFDGQVATVGEFRYIAMRSDLVVVFTDGRV